MDAIRNSLKESFEAVIHMAESLAVYNPDGGVGERRFYKGATLDNVRKAADSLDNLNFTDDEGIKEIQKRMRNMVEGHTLESTKQNKASREVLVAEANDIIEKNFSSFGF